MAKKIIPTWLKIAAATALLFPYELSYDQEEGKLKKVTYKSLAAHVTYKPATEDEKSELNVHLLAAFNRGIDNEELEENAILSYDELMDDEELLADFGEE